MSEPDNTAVRTALWRALHLLVDAPPHVLVDDLALRLADPPDGWRDRGDMHPMGTRPFRASIVARARFVEDLVASTKPAQYVILGAGLDTFAQRHPNHRVFEIDQPGPQAWKRERLAALGLSAPTLVPVDFEAGMSWLAQLAAAGFDRALPTVVAATGVSMYLERETNAQLLREVASLPHATFVSSFILPLELAGDEVKPGLATSAKGARAAGTPFKSFFAPEDYVGLARQAGFAKVDHVSADDLASRYFADRTDGLRPPPRGEELVVAGRS